MRCFWLNKKKYFLFLFLSVSILYVIFRPVYVLEMSFNNHSMLFPFTSTLILSVQYVHSVSLTDVVDVYRINKTGIFAVEEKWKDFMAGQPLNGTIENGYFVSRMDKNLGYEWKYWFIKENRFEIRIDNRTVFVQPDEDGILSFRIKQVPNYMLIVPSKR